MDASRHVSRGAGQSAVAAAAYRSGEKLYDERAQEVHDYTRRYGVLTHGITMPERGGAASADGAWSREQLWNAAEVAEKRKDARVARKLELALPAEMTPAQREELVRTWAGEIANRYGVAVDWAIHLPDKEGDQRNHHAHLMMTVREIGPEGFQGKAALELSNTDQKKRGLAVGDDAIYALREALAERLNQVAQRHGLDLYADPRSYAERGIELTPTKHIGVHAVAMDRKGLETERAEAHAEVRQENARRVIARPELVLEALTAREAVFTRQDIARELHRHLDDPEEFQGVMAKLDASPELVRLTDSTTREPSRFSTRTMIAIEERMMAVAGELAASSARGVDTDYVRVSLARHARLSEEQRDAVQHITGPAHIAAVAGAAGAGKSASLAAAREAWEAKGYRVRGAALAGKAADELQASAGIESRTLHAHEYSWGRGRDPLSSRDVLVIDEAGMVGSRQMGRVLEAARDAGAKVVLVGDARQLQPIEAGAAFRAIAEQIGVVEIETIRRQRREWAREASQAFASGAVREGITTYAARGHVHMSESRDSAKAAMARDSASAAWGEGQTLILAHTNEDVRDVNRLVRGQRQQAGALGEEAAFRAERGERQFAAGDRLVFLKNDRELGVKNGTLATVELAEPGCLVARLDGGDRIRIDQATYAHVDHGYAVTLHKAQGATVDRTFVLASGGMDRHLIYVGMTRHRDDAALYAGRDDFRDEGAMMRRLSRARPKVSSLDFAERRGFETEKPWLENARAWLDRGRERLAEAWERAEQVFTAVRERFAGQERVGETMPEKPAEQGRAEALRAAFRQEAERSLAERQEALRQQFGQEQAPGKDAEAQRQALRDAFAQETQTKPKTAEQLRAAMQEKGKPTAERRQGKEQDRDRSL
jgi:Ti-type conjugative transfer relaxase TraA